MLIELKKYKSLYPGCLVVFGIDNQGQQVGVPLEGEEDFFAEGDREALGLMLNAMQWQLDRPGDFWSGRNAKDPRRTRARVEIVDNQLQLRRGETFHPDTAVRVTVQGDGSVKYCGVDQNGRGMGIRTATAVVTSY